MQLWLYGARSGTSTKYMAKNQQTGAALQESQQPEPNTGTPIPVPDEIAKLDAEGAATADAPPAPQCNDPEHQNLERKLELAEETIEEYKSELIVRENELTRITSERDAAVASHDLAVEKHAKQVEALSEIENKVKDMEIAYKPYDELRDYLSKTTSDNLGRHAAHVAIELLQKQGTGNDMEKLLHIARYFVSKARYQKQMDQWVAGVDQHLTMEQRVLLVKPEEIEEALAYQFPETN